MSKIQHQLSRKCMVCGETKPLTAFLQQRGSYGNTCVTCKTKAASSDDDQGSTSKGLRIDDKAKILAEQEQQRHLQEKDDLVDETFEKREKLEEEKKQKSENILFEKKQREGYLNIKNALLTTPSSDEQEIQEQTIESAKSEQQQEQHNLQVKQAEQQQQIETTADYTAPFLPLSHAKFTAPDQLKLMRWLGSSNPQTKIFEQAFGQKVAEQPAKSGPTEAPSAKEKKSATEWARTLEQHRVTSQSLLSNNPQANQQKKASVTEKIEQNIGPASQKKR